MAHTTVRRLLLSLIVVAAMPAASRAAQDTWDVGTAPSLSSGSYGTETRTDVVYTPVTARRLFTDGDISVVFPFTCIRGGGVTLVNGTPVPIERGGRRPAAGVRPARGTAANPDPAPATAASNVCGMGDIVVRGRYYLLDERSWIPTIAVRAHVKAPTADAERGLGTGHADQGVGVEISRSLGRRTLVMVDGGYTAIGQSREDAYDNRWWYDVGIGHDLAGGVVNVSVFFEEYSAIVPGFVNARDALTAVQVKMPGGWRVQAAGEVGLSEAAPAYGVTLGMNRRF